MLKIIRNIIRYYITLCGLIINGIAINFLSAKAPSIKELVIPTPEEYMQTFIYAKYITTIIMFTLLIISVSISFLSHYPDKKDCLQYKRLVYNMSKHQ